MSAYGPVAAESVLTPHSQKFMALEAEITSTGTFGQPASRFCFAEPGALGQIGISNQRGEGRGFMASEPLAC